MGKCLFLRKGETHTKPISGILANTLAVGSTVKLMENGSPVEYLVVHQGLPSSMYDTSCDGCWLLRKDLYKVREWHSSDVCDYENSTIHTYLNGDFLNLLGSIEQASIKQVKIPYRKGSGTAEPVNSGSNGLSARIFLLGGYEVGWTQSNNSYFPIDGAKLSYFISGTGTDANNRRLAKLTSSNVYWWLRSPYTRFEVSAWIVQQDGSYMTTDCHYTRGIRPALILPSKAVFDKNTLILKGVA